MDFPTRRRPFCYGDIPDEPPTVFVGFAVAGVFVISFAADSVGDFSRYERNLVYGFRFAPDFVNGGFLQLMEYDSAGAERCYNTAVWVSYLLVIITGFC